MIKACTSVSGRSFGSAVLYNMSLVMTKDIYSTALLKDLSEILVQA